MDDSAKEKDREYKEKKASTPMEINDGLDHTITEEQKRVNLKKFRKMRGHGV